MRIFLALFALLFALASPSAYAQDTSIDMNDVVYTRPISLTGTTFGTPGVQTYYYDPSGNQDASSGGSGGQGYGQKPPSSSDMTSQWYDSNGGFHKVTTPRNGWESVNNQAWRHKTAVNALGDLFPPTAGTWPAKPTTTGGGWQSSAGSIMRTSWHSGNMVHSVETPPDPGEDPTVQAKRHAKAVQALQTVFPPSQNATFGGGTGGATPTYIDVPLDSIAPAVPSVFGGGGGDAVGSLPNTITISDLGTCVLKRAA